MDTMSGKDPKYGGVQKYCNPYNPLFPRYICFFVS